MTKLVDTHAHLCDSSFRDDLEEVLERARAAGVTSIVAVAEDLDEALRNLELATTYPEMVRPAAGLFPTNLDLEQADRVIDLIRLQQQRLVAIGEVGLDLWKVQEPAGRAIQREIFCRFIELSLELDLPLNVHSRAAGRQTVELLLGKGAQRVQLHAFDGRAAKALPAVEAGYFFSVPPSVVRSAQKQKLVRRLPLEALLVETDSPVLGAEANLRNEPSEVGISVQAIADLHERPIEEVIETVGRNCQSLYGPQIW